MTMTQERAHAVAERVRKEGGCSEVGQALLVLDDAAPRWISVEDRLPEYGDVLALFCGQVTLATYFKLGFDCEIDERVTVTHWMPLPSAPEMGR